MKLIPQLVCLLIMALAGLPAYGQASAASSPSLPEPPDRWESWDHEQYGDARSIELLSSLLDSPDIRARQRAAGELGQTRNPQAISHIEKAVKDSSAQVRSAAVAGLRNFEAGQVADLLLKALGDSSPDVQIAAMNVARELNVSGAAEAVSAMVASANPSVREQALATLTVLNVPASEGALVKLLNDSSVIVRLRAAQNALLLDKGQALVPVLMELAAAGDGAVRCEALVALGKLDMAAAEQIIKAAAKDSNALVRLGALGAMEQASRKNDIAPFLNDSSEMVRLSAIRAVGRLKCVNCRERLMELMHSASLDEVVSLDSHAAAMASLVALDDPQVPAQVARLLPAAIEQWNDLTAQLDRAVRDAAANKGNMGRHVERQRELVAQRRIATRQLQAFFRLLGSYKSRLAFADQIRLLPLLETDSPVLGDLAWSLGQIKDQQASAGLLKQLDVCTKMARRFLKTKDNVPPPYVPYRPDVTAEIVLALGQLGHKEALPRMMELATMKENSSCLDMPVLAAIEAMPKLASPADMAKYHDVLVTVITDSSSCVAARYMAVKQAGRMGVKSAQPAIEKLLFEDRPGQIQMAAAAWSLWQLTGKAVPAGEPAPSPGNWIILNCPATSGR